MNKVTATVKKDGRRSDKVTNLKAIFDITRARMIKNPPAWHTLSNGS